MHCLSIVSILWTSFQDLAEQNHKLQNSAASFQKIEELIKEKKELEGKIDFYKKFFRVVGIAENNHVKSFRVADAVGNFIHYKIIAVFKSRNHGRAGYHERLNDEHPDRHHHQEHQKHEAHQFPGRFLLLCFLSFNFFHALNITYKIIDKKVNSVV